MITPWPPLITDAAQPAWMVWRDRALTAAMWLLLFGICHREILLLWAALHEVLGGPVAEGGGRWGLLWDHLRPYAMVTGVLLAWLVVWGGIALRHVLRVTRQPVPPPLDPALEAEQSGVAPETLRAWRTLPVAVVHIGETGRYRVAPKQDSI